MPRANGDPRPGTALTESWEPSSHVAGLPSLNSSISVLALHLGSLCIEVLPLKRGKHFIKSWKWDNSTQQKCSLYLDGL